MITKQIKYLISISVLVLALPFVVFAAPLIDSVSVSDGVLTINGSNFGTRSNSPIMYEDFEDGVNDYTFGSPTISSTVNRTGSNYSIKSGNYGGVRTTDSSLSSSPTYYWSSWFYLPSNWEITDGWEQIKIFRASAGDSYPNIYLNIRDTSYNFFWACEGGDCQTYISSGGDSAHELLLVGEWQRLDFYVAVSSSVGSADGTVKLWRNGELLKSANGLITSSSSPVYYDGGMSAPNTQFSNQTDQYAYYDDVYMDIYLSRVELSNNSEWTEATQQHNEVQPSISWSDSTIQVNYNLGSFSGEQPLYCFVIDSSGNVSNGVLVSGNPPPTTQATGNFSIGSN